MGTTRLDDIRDPEAGLALASREPPNETLESRTRRQFWKVQFICWRDWLAGDSAAIPRAIYCCKRANHSPPQWLCDASVVFAERGMSPAELERQNDFARHRVRWEAVVTSQRRECELRATSPDTPHVSWLEHYERAAEELSRIGAVASIDTISGSYKLIQEAGGANATLESYQRTARKFNRRRRARK